MSEVSLKLHDAICMPNCMNAVKLLMDEEPALAYLRDSERHTPLHTVALNLDMDHVEIAKVILGITVSANGGYEIKRPELLNMQDLYGWTVLHYAAGNRQVEFIRALMEWGADVFVHDEIGNNALHALAYQGNMDGAVESGKVLLEIESKEVLVNMKNFKGKTVIDIALNFGALKFLEFIIQPCHGFKSYG